MIKFISKFFLLTPIILLLAVVESLLRQVPNDYSYKNKWLTENASSLKILVVGASHGYCGINPSYFSQKAFNAGEVSQSLNWDYFIVDKFISKFDSLQFLIIPVSAPTLFTSLDKSTEYWREKNYHIYWGGSYYAHFYQRFDPVNRLAIYNTNNLITAIQKIIAFRKTGYYKLNCTDLGFCNLYRLEERDQDWDKNGPLAAKQHTYWSNHEKEYRENLAYLEKIIVECKQRNIKVILLTTPAWHTYTDNLNKDQLDLTFTTCQNLAEQNNNVSYINLLYDKRFTADDYMDSHHLCIGGAKKLTLLLNDTLPKLR